MNKTSIEWTDFTWNPIRAHNTRANRTGTFCTKISPGCKNCYASVINRRFGTGCEYEVPELKHHIFSLSDKILREPITRKKPARIFVGDMFDLWHEAIPDAMIAEVLRVALKTPRHTFQFLTKRAERMRRTVTYAQEHWGVKFGPHMWFGVSVEDRERAEQRIPQLQMTQAVVRFLSIEPQLENIPTGFDTPELGFLSWLHPFQGADPPIPRIDWVICGGESGPGARPFNLEWAVSLLSQCRAAGVPFFMKQTGANLFCQDCADHNTHFCGKYKPHDGKGGDPAEWPEALRVREFPSQKAEAVSA